MTMKIIPDSKQLQDNVCYLWRQTGEGLLLVASGEDAWNTLFSGKALSHKDQTLPGAIQKKNRFDISFDPPVMLNMFWQI